jgi:hypothetical protein
MKNLLDVFIGKCSEIPVYLMSGEVVFSTLNKGCSLNACDSKLCQQQKM